MKSVARTACFATLVGTAALVAVTSSAASASADSGEQVYTCWYMIGSAAESEAAATVSFDSAIPHGLVVHVGDLVSLDPSTGTMGIPDEFTDLLRAAGATTISGQSGMVVTVFSYLNTTSSSTTMFFDPTPVPAEGSMSLDLKFDSPGDIRPDRPGTYLVGFGSIALEISGGNLPDELQFFCELPEGSSAPVDSFKAVAAVTPSAAATPTGTVTPARPVLVQTDFAEHDSTVAPLMGLGALMTVTAGGVGLARRRRHGTSRQH
jgi:hypothetical protein